MSNILSSFFPAEIKIFRQRCLLWLNTIKKKQSILLYSVGLYKNAYYHPKNYLKLSRTRSNADLWTNAFIFSVPILCCQVRSLDPYRLQQLDVYSNLLYVVHHETELTYLAHFCADVNKYCKETCAIIANFLSLRYFIIAQDLLVSCWIYFIYQKYFADILKAKYLI